MLPLSHTAARLGRTTDSLQRQTLPFNGFRLPGTALNPMGQSGQTYLPGDCYCHQYPVIQGQSQKMGNNWPHISRTEFRQEG
ncbi:hypothetical protein GDO81_020593 [Engystomops pustulosus]|uniref:Uncharacterized protein n=1 Tax=Engystomops pustulosus TaxID=76066 RepID=A0AAV6YXE0_ENGPU|nr:hypothetical protein GDO81_020593 [Engystomops pustulosus]